MSHTDDIESDTIISLNFATILLFFVIICCLLIVCFPWDLDCWNYRAPKEREYVIRHVIVRDGNEEYI